MYAITRPGLLLSLIPLLPFLMMTLIYLGSIDSATIQRTQMLILASNSTEHKHIFTQNRSMVHKSDKPVSQSRCKNKRSIIA
jgi:hypothetical protein